MDARRVLVALGVAAAAAAALPLRAQDIDWARRDYDFATRQLDDFMWRHQRSLVDPVARAVRRNAQPGQAPAAAPAPRQTEAASTVVPDRAAQVPAAMAAQYPAAERARMQRTFEQLLELHHTVERKFGVPRRDLAGAAAAYLTGAYMAYHHTEVPDEWFPPLVAQMRGILAAEPAQAAAPLPVRQEMYEQLAIVGMFAATLQTGLKQHPDAAMEQRMRAAGKGYLEQLLKVDADRVQLTERGLVLR
jgi:hypothetical protein